MNNYDVIHNIYTQVPVMFIDKNLTICLSFYFLVHN